MKKLLKDGKNFVFVGAHNPFIARLVEKASFDGIYLSGAGLSNSLGVSDTGILDLEDFTYFGKKIAAATKLPVIADADTGFGNVAATVEAYIKAGVAALHIEDQVFPKRCGHLSGKEVVSIDEMVEKIKAAARTRDRTGVDFAIIARTDARGADNITAGEQFAEVVKRAIAYKKAGADIIFPESLQSVQEFHSFRQQVEGSLLANMTEFGKTPLTKAEEFFRLGYQIVIFPVSIFRYLAGEATRALDILKKDGNQRNLVPKMMERSEINKLLNYDPKKG